MVSDNSNIELSLTSYSKKIIILPMLQIRAPCILSFHRFFLAHPRFLWDDKDKVSHGFCVLA